MSYDSAGARVPGARREKLRGYLKAANELRQSYQETLQQRLQDDGEGTQRDFPDTEIVRRGDEELILFPSYARRHIKRKDTDGQRNQPGSYSDDAPHSSGDADYWKLEWEKFEDANAVVDVDVRGWIYSPQRGPPSRRNRLLIAVARRLSGIPAPPTSSPNTSRSSSPHPYDAASRSEEAAAQREAEQIAQRGQKEADAAWRGSYSTQQPGQGLRGSPKSTRSSSPVGHARNRSTNIQDPDVELNKRASWSNQSMMSHEELLKANDLLMTRLKPFMTQPLANTTITVFFFNERKSSSKSVTTNDSGHFNVRAALDFIPSQVRVLASEDLSATEEVHVTEARGVSLISDVDDTIKHSAIASGVKEIFKNTFVRELEGLTIKGVKEWYGRLADMDVKLHYVSNSPWQLYPLLKSYFQLAGLPPGSFHLKEYSGMLQGIFEPAAERKKGSLDRIMNDFPERKFILVGDSGEADLEVYTDVVLQHPGRVLGVFIRDVTTTASHGFFDQSNVPLPDSASERSVRARNSAADLSDAKKDRPALPSRPQAQAQTVEDLIDFSDDTDNASVKSATSTSSHNVGSVDRSRSNGGPPTRPNKPSNLRNFSSQSPGPPAPANEQTSSPTSDNAKKAPPPPKPRRSSRTVAQSDDTAAAGQRPAVDRFYSYSTSGELENSSRPPTIARTQTSSSTRSSYSSYSTRSDEGYVAAAQRRLNNAYNALPQIRSVSPKRSDGGPPVPPRRGLTAAPAAAARWVTGASGGDPQAGGDGGAPGADYNKKEEMWKRRWAHAQEIMGRQRIVLRTWRVGSDVMEECLRLVEREMGEQKADWRR
ncbi:Phosphatidate phosphatase APP1 [Cyphellophora attinorum]|uniref:Phosphatidate phosphatase APP1 n=1 Tax=Cyphellophora attinorum TaxID=1664694 RepID=A0A0N1H6U7_9EURO|nr:Phosphatidate phosphatase APP1 [Phialophora attinorum]KPI38537.1 Phosphatidate phosphatase APP1 [Phialophora attinorum]